MEWVIYLVGVLWIALGCYYILYTTNARENAMLVMDHVDRHLLAVAAAVFGAVLIAAAFYTRFTAPVIFIGLLGIAKGIYLFVNPGGTYQVVRRWYGEASDQTYRFFGILFLILGTAFISWA